LKRSKSAIALTLTFVSGYADIVGYLSVYHAFSANMTGNTVHFGHQLVSGAWVAAMLSLSIVAAFLCGSILGRGIMEVASRIRLRTVATVNLALEAALFLVFIALAGTTARGAGSSATVPGQAWLLLLLAAAMGLQTATITRIGSLTIHTTFVTGMLNKFAQLVSHLLFHYYDEKRSTAREHHELMVRRNSRLRQAGFVGSIWVLYVCGATGGTWAYFRWGNSALYVPVGLLLLSIGIDQARPLSIEEERDQSER
jgi:uncharacterized membrane protein YoaK (UPF0700 family)